MIDKQDNRRQSLRLTEYDYSQPGAYFVTICTQDRECLLGDIVNGEMRLNAAGQMVQSVWDDIPSHYLGIETDAFVIMSNHIHAIIVLVGAAPCGRPNSDKGQARGPAPTTDTILSLSDVVHRFKTMTTKRYADGVKQNGWPAFMGRFWQRNYYEHVIRNEADLAEIREYILNNPARWNEDENNPDLRHGWTC